MRRTAIAILMCATMVLVAAVPLALADTHTITKGEKGPNASAKTWDYVPASYGYWSAHIVNNGLRWAVVDVYDNSIGAMEHIMHQRIRFAAYDAFPSGVVDSRSVLVSPTHTYAITITPNGPRGSSCTVDDILEQPPVARFTATVSYLSVYFDATASSDPDGTVASYAWDFGDGQIGSGMTVTHDYVAAKTYTVVLTVTDDDGYTGSASQDVTTELPPAAPIARFTATPNWMVVSVDGSASSDSDGVIASYAWDWGDGSSDTFAISTAQHTYSVEKTYTIRLTVTDNDFMTGWVEHDVVARLPHPPTASFTATPTHLSVAVNASGSSDTDGSIISCAWDWGDGSPVEILTVVTASHTYTSKGLKTITLTVTDNDLLTGTTTRDVTLIDQIPVARFTPTVDGLVVSVNATTSSDDYGIVSYTWNWGDESAEETFSTATATHTYTATLAPARMIVASYFAAPESVGPNQIIPPPPGFMIGGFTKDETGTVLPFCTVTITLVKTGQFAVVSSGAIGFYSYVPTWSTLSVGDQIEVSAVNAGGDLTGESTGIVPNGPNLTLDVTLSPAAQQPHNFTVTLTVRDMLNQANSVSQVVVIYW